MKMMPLSAACACLLSGSGFIRQNSDSRGPESTYLQVVAGDTQGRGREHP
jgi:hypothetical protein